MNRPVRRALTAAVAGLALLAGCSDNPEPAPLEPAASSPSASESPDGAPEMPEEAKENTPEGAEAFVRHWVDSLNHAAAGGDLRSLRSASSPSCAACRGAAERVHSVTEAGGSFEGGEWIVKSTSAIPAADGRTAVDVELDISPQRVIEAEGQAPLRYRGGASFKVFTLEYAKQAWSVVDVEDPS